MYADALDAIMIQLLGYAVIGTVVALLAEMAVPESLAAGCARVYTAWMQVRKGGQGRGAVLV